MPVSGNACCCIVMSAARPVQAARGARRLQERTRNVEEFGYIEQEGIMSAIGLDLGEGYPRGGCVERMHQRARFRSRKQPVAGERHHAEPRLDAAKGLRQHAVMI